MQKKFTLLLVTCFFSSLSFSQILKGTGVIHFGIGDIQSFHLQNKDHSKNNYVAFNPAIGYFVKNNWEVGVGANFRSFHYMDTVLGGHYENNRTTGINLYTKYYFGKGKLKPYLLFQTGLNHSSYKYSGPGTPLNSSSNDHIYLGIGGGIDWNISSRFSLFAEAVFTKEFPLNKYGYFHSNISIGARFYFNKSKKH